MQARKLICMTLGLAVVALVLAGPGISASGSSISLKAKPRIVDYTHPTKFKGSLSTGRKGVPLILEAKRFPFNSGFSKVAGATTAKHGKFTFKRKQTAATRYFVALKNDPSVRSKVRTAYISPHFFDVACWISPSNAPSVKYPCRRDSLPPGAGNWIIHETFKVRYPAAYQWESQKAEYVYYGQRNGAKKFPKELQLKKQVSQHPFGPNVTRVAYTIPFSSPSSAWGNLWTSCHRDSEPIDGIGLPGHHHCGDPSITRRQAFHHLG
jgi:hypothetical protein